MKLSDFRTMIRAMVPGAKISVIEDATLDILINKGVDDVNSLTYAYTGSKKFNVTAEDGDYEIVSDVADDFLLPGLTGLWWYNGTDWEALDPYTLKQLKSEFPLWMDDNSGDPQRYVVDNDRLIIHPKPDTTLADGFMFDDYIKAATWMTSGDHYPFTGSTTELHRLKDLDDAVIDYVRWKLQAMIGKDQKGVISEQDYFNQINIKSRLIKRRPDLPSNSQFKMKGPTIV